MLREHVMFFYLSWQAKSAGIYHWFRIRRELSDCIFNKRVIKLGMECFSQKMKNPNFDSRLWSNTCMYQVSWWRVGKVWLTRFSTPKMKHIHHKLWDLEVLENIKKNGRNSTHKCKLQRKKNLSTAWKLDFVSGSWNLFGNVRNCIASATIMFISKNKFYHLL